LSNLCDETLMINLRFKMNHMPDIIAELINIRVYDAGKNNIYSFGSFNRNNDNYKTILVFFVQNVRDTLKE